MQQERIRWLDASRGLAIILVVLGHNLIPKAVWNYIYSFHVPVFFVIAGYLFGMSKTQGFAQHLKKKARTLLVPYAVFYVVLYIYFVAIGSRYGETKSADLVTPIIGFFYSSSDYLVDIFRPMWFLTTLFVVEMLFFGIARYFRRAFFIVLILCSVLGYLGSLYLPFRLPWGLDTAFTAVVFYGIGYAVRKAGLKSLPGLKWPNLILVPGFLAANYFLGRWNGGVSLLSNDYGSYFLFYSAAITGVCGCILIARLLQRLDPLTFIGKNSLIIFALHATAVGLIRGFMKIVLKYPMQNMHNSLGWGVALTAAAIASLVPVIYVLNRYFPFILGKGGARAASVPAAPE